MSSRRRSKAGSRNSVRRRQAPPPFWRRWQWHLSASVRTWLRRVAVALLLVFVVAPTVLIFLYRLVPPPVTPLMVIRLVEGYGLERDWVAWEEISPNLRMAVVAAEDNLFCQHGGFDWRSLETAAKAFAAGERAGGGSTISMQTAKNLFLWPSRSVIRKGLEVPLTAGIETLWPKQRILEVYLNVAELGPGIYGAEAAAQHYFGRPASDLTQTQAARLAATLPNPLEWRPQPAGNYVARRANTIRTRIRQLGPLLDCVRD